MADFTFAHREEGFDEHINNSIRGYSDLLQDTISLSRYFIEFKHDCQMFFLNSSCRVCVVGPGEYQPNAEGIPCPGGTFRFASRNRGARARGDR